MPLPGITLNTSAIHYRPIKDGRMVEFRDGQFVVVSELLHGNSGAVRKHFRQSRSRERGRVARGADGEDCDAA